MKQRLGNGSVVTAIAAILCVSQGALASLGGSADTVANDRRSLATTRYSTRSSALFTVVESTAATVAVREYLSADGIVFGVAWNGIVQPDLSILLGGYADEYRKTRARQPHTGGRRAVRVATSRIVVEKWGHARNFKGRAYVPALIPPGVSIDEIK